KWFGNWRSGFRTAVDSTGDGKYAFVPAGRTAKPVIEAAPAARFNVQTPAIARPGETVPVRVAALDYLDNPAHPAPTGDIFAANPAAPFVPVARATLREDDAGSATLEVRVPEDAATFRVVVANRRDNLIGTSPLTVVDDRPGTMNVYFGDIHAHTMLSDGLKTPAECLEHARDVALMDFGAITDHNFEEASRLEGPFRMQMSDEAFTEIQAACEAMNEPGRFVTLQGFEQNRITGYKGHRNVYFRGVCPGLFRGKTLDELYDYLDGHKALSIPHHTIIWNTRPHLDNPRYERVVEMYSMHCSSEARGTAINNYETTPSKAETGVSAREMLNAGYRLGFIAGSDNHNGAPGLSARPSRFTNLVYRGGVAAVLAPELTREAVFDALYERRCYATTGARIYLDFRLGGQLMGSEIEAERSAALPYEITVAGTAALSSVEIVTQSGEETIRRHAGADFVRLDGERTFDRENAWMYVRVTQIDKQMAWSSPVWVSAR
ncbi:MAG: CehA/McbA family metallohydrolase, partial [Planctomycetes bacterium]|nr:CehA/McbA family metallohydrolase [Planctomycetota bacterium]